MSRPLRIEFPDAWYHVMNRGRRAEDIFLDDEDYNTFFDLLKESVDLWNVRIAAYCLMPNHYHILVQTPGANLSRCMRHIDGVYTRGLIDFIDLMDKYFGEGLSRFLWMPTVIFCNL